MTKRVLRTILMWAFLIVVYLFLFPYLSHPYSIWESSATVGFLLVLALINVRRGILQSKEIFLNNDLLTVKQSFQKEKHLHLSNIQSWTQHTHITLGIQTSQKIVLRLSETDTIDIWNNDNQTEFEKLSDYLNNCLEDKYVEEK